LYIFNHKFIAYIYLYKEMHTLTMHTLRNAYFGLFEKIMSAGKPINSWKVDAISIFFSVDIHYA